MESRQVCINSLKKRPENKGVAWALIQSGLLAAGACFGVRFFSFSGEERNAACAGVAAAWVASAVGTVALAAGMRSTAKAFWSAFGAGMLLRLAILAGLAAYAWMRPKVSAPGLLIAYAMGTAGLLLVEYRHLVR